LPIATLILGNDVAGVVSSGRIASAAIQARRRGLCATDKDRIGRSAEFIAMNEDAVADQAQSITMEERLHPSGGPDRVASVDRTSELEEGTKVLIHAGSGG